MYGGCHVEAFFAAILVAAVMASAAHSDTLPSSDQPSKTKELLTDAAIVALLIAASIASYKSMGKPCACPEDTMRNGRRCGGNSAWARAAGYKPLCYPTDVTGAMIDAYRSK